MRENMIETRDGMRTAYLYRVVPDDDMAFDWLPAG